MRTTKKYQVITLVSTVMPGDVENHLKPALEHASGKECGKDFGLCYNPEFIALGNVIKGLLNPDFVLIGEYDKRSGDVVEQVYREMCENNPPMERMSIINAEIAKIALNSYITMKMTFANILAEICERYKGADVDAVTKALGRDRRISPYYLKGALSYGGPCFPRDNRAFYLSAKRVGCEARLPLVIDELNEQQNERVVSLILKELGNKGGKVAFLGLSYKPETDVIEESASIKIIRRLLQSGKKVTVYDPAAMATAKEELGNLVEYSNNMEECVKDADLCVIATPWEDFLELPNILSRINKDHLTIIDCWRILRENVTQLPLQCKYIGLGLYREERRYK
jgi:UDPglucose 6-dehydrogenase